MVFDGDALSYQDMLHMDMAEWAECVAAKEMYVEHLKKLTKQKGG